MRQVDTCRWCSAESVLEPSLVSVEPTEKKRKRREMFGGLFWAILEELSETTLSRVKRPLRFQELSARNIEFLTAELFKLFASPPTVRKNSPSDDVTAHSCITL